MISGRDLADSLHLLSLRTVAVLDVDAAGGMLADENVRLRAIAASHESVHFLEMFSLQLQEGICIDVYRTGEIEQTSSAGTAARWPRFSRLVVDHGYGCLCGVPLRQDGEVIGAMNLFRETAQPLDESNVRLAQALANV